MTEKIPVLVSGSGNFSQAAIRALQADTRFALSSNVLGYRSDKESPIVVDDIQYVVIPPKNHSVVIEKMCADYDRNWIIVDGVKSAKSDEKDSVVFGNVERWSALRVPFVMGSTLNNEKRRNELENVVTSHDHTGFLAVNFARFVARATDGIVAYCANPENKLMSERSFVNATESHQGNDALTNYWAGKNDASGTARKIVEAFTQLGFSGSHIGSIRSQFAQNALLIPTGYRKAHGHHHYELNFGGRGAQEDALRILSFFHKLLDQQADLLPQYYNPVVSNQTVAVIGRESNDTTANMYVTFSESEYGYVVGFAHNINGRKPYGDGVVSAVPFTFDRFKRGLRGVSRAKDLDAVVN